MVNVGRLFKPLNLTQPNPNQRIPPSHSMRFVVGVVHPFLPWL